MRNYCVECKEVKGINCLTESGYCETCRCQTYDYVGAIELAMKLLEFAGWQPMETAPRDGTWVMAHYKLNHTPIVIRYDDYDGRFPEYPWHQQGRSKAYSCDDLVGWLQLPEIKGVKG